MIELGDDVVDGLLVVWLLFLLILMRLLSSSTSSEGVEEIEKLLSITVFGRSLLLLYCVEDYLCRGLIWLGDVFCVKRERSDVETAIP